jgi:hypothetical protein
MLAVLIQARLRRWSASVAVFQHHLIVQIQAQERRWTALAVAAGFLQFGALCHLAKRASPGRWMLLRQ